MPPRRRTLAFALSTGVALASAGCGQGASTSTAIAIEDAGASSADAADGAGMGADAGAGADPNVDAGLPASDARTEVLYGERVRWGTVDPASLAPGVRTIAASNGARGLHFFCAPEDAARWNGRTLLHLVGTGDTPAATNGILKRACALGFAGLAPMYENERDARSSCRSDAACYLAMRQTIVYGQPFAGAPFAIDDANGILRRTEQLLAHVAGAEAGAFAPWSTIRARFLARTLESFALSGHSQGSGHALLVARDFQVERLVMLGGVTDRLASGTAGNAAPTWIATFATSGAKTPSSRFLGYVHEDDTIAVYAQVASNYDALGLGADCTFLPTGAAYPSACRRVRGAAAGCTGFNAHASVVLRAFGSAADACAFPGDRFTNTTTWAFLLTAPL
jgi:hypothetical protein